MPEHTNFIAIGKGSFDVSIKHATLSMDAINTASIDNRPSGVGRFYSVKKGCFDSTIEWARGVWLYNLLHQGVITNLSHHSIITFGSDRGDLTYEADFTYFCNNKLVIEEVKPGAVRSAAAHVDCSMTIGTSYASDNNHIKLVSYDTHIRRIAFLLNAANIDLYVIPILGTTSFFRDTRKLAKYLKGLLEHD